VRKRIILDANRRITNVSGFYRISENSSSEEDTSVCKKWCHELLSLPVTMRSKNKKGVRLEKGTVLDNDYKAPVLEEAIKKELCDTYNTHKRSITRAIPVVVAPMRGQMRGNPIAAMAAIVGCVLALLTLPSVFGKLSPD